MPMHRKRLETTEADCIQRMHLPEQDGSNVGLVFPVILKYTGG